MASQSRKRDAGPEKGDGGRGLLTPHASPVSTIGQLLDDASAALRRAGVERPDAQALATWSALTGAAPGSVWLDRASPPPAGGLADRFGAAIARQAAGEPPQYTVNVAGFRFLDLFV